jgi:hypothetical protein
MDEVRASLGAEGARNGPGAALARVMLRFLETLVNLLLDFQAGRLVLPAPAVRGGSVGNAAGRNDAAAPVFFSWPVAYPGLADASSGHAGGGGQAGSQGGTEISGAAPRDGARPSPQSSAADAGEREWRPAAGKEQAAAGVLAPGPRWRVRCGLRVRRSRIAPRFGFAADRFIQAIDLRRRGGRGRAREPPNFKKRRAVRDVFAQPYCCDIVMIYHPPCPG